MLPTASPLLPILPATARSNSAETAEERDAGIRRAAKEFEATFIAEMLTYAGFDKALSSRAGFGGEAFSRMLIDSYASEIAEGGSFGLADKIYSQLKDFQP